MKILLLVTACRFLKTKNFGFLMVPNFLFSWNLRTSVWACILWSEGLHLFVSCIFLVSIIDKIYNCTLLNYGSRSPRGLYAVCSLEGYPFICFSSMFWLHMLVSFENEQKGESENSFWVSIRVRKYMRTTFWSLSTRYLKSWLKNVITQPNPTCKRIEPDLYFLLSSTIQLREENRAYPTMQPKLLYQNPHWSDVFFWSNILWWSLIRSQFYIQYLSDALKRKRETPGCHVDNTMPIPPSPCQ